MPLSQGAPLIREAMRPLWLVRAESQHLDERNGTQVFRVSQTSWREADSACAKRGVKGRVCGEGLLSSVGDRGWDTSGLSLMETTFLT